MKNIFKKKRSFVIIVVALLVLLGFAGVKYNWFSNLIEKVVPETPKSAFRYTELDDGTIEICGLEGRNYTEIKVPNEINGKSVTSIGENAFEFCYRLKNITIPDTLKKTEDGGYELK